MKFEGMPIAEHYEFPLLKEIGIESVQLINCEVNSERLKNYVAVTTPRKEDVAFYGKNKLEARSKMEHYLETQLIKKQRDLLIKTLALEDATMLMHKAGLENMTNHYNTLEIKPEGGNK